MPFVTQFDPPGMLDDFSPATKQAWSTWISGQIDDCRDRADPAVSNYGPRPQFFNPKTTEIAADAQSAVVEWPAFPKKITTASLSNEQRWKTADSSRDFQDEYCEWSVSRDPNTKKLLRVTFTCEGPEYWEVLASSDPAKLLALYQQHISPMVKETDLLRNGHYVRRNFWNTSTEHGAMHLVQDANSLGAEIELAAAATLQRVGPTGVLTQPQELIRCGRYGDPGRNSDPFIGSEVNKFARAKADITLANPVGLYFSRVDFARWETPDNSNPADYWKWERGADGYRVRAAYEVPAAKGFVVGDIKIDGNLIQWGSQIVDKIQMKLVAIACRLGLHTDATPVGCVSKIVAPPGTTVKHLLASNLLMRAFR